MFKKKEKKGSNILLLINLSYGEIDWILPVCRVLKIKHPNVKLTVLFKSLHKEQIIKGNQFLFYLLENNVHECYDFHDFLPKILESFTISFHNIQNKENCPKLIRIFYKQYFSNLIMMTLSLVIFNKINPNIILKDKSEDSWVRKKLVEWTKKSGRDIMFPHASTLYYTKPPNSWLHRHFADDILCNTEWMAKLFSNGKNNFSNNKHVVGVPRYDKWWINYLIKNWDQSSLLKFNNKNIKNTFLIYTRGGHPHSFDEEEAMKRLKKFIDIINEFEDSAIILKPHPRQNISNIKRVLVKNNYNNCTIDLSHPICLSSIADVVISMANTSALLDSLAVGKSTILFLNRKERVNNEFEKLGLCPVVETYEDLKKIVSDSLKKPDFSKKYVEKFVEIFNNAENKATINAVNVILGNDKVI